MRPANFPGRRLRRQLRSQMPSGDKWEPVIPQERRAVRTKKPRGKRGPKP